MTSATAQHGETLDALCWRVLGTTVPVAAVYELNPGLAASGPVLPDGAAVILPSPTRRAAPLRETITLWS